MPLLEVRDLRTGYGTLPVLGGISFDVEQGETVVLLGLNGAGKTTLVHAIAGIQKPWEGTITFEGKDVTNLDTRKMVGEGIVLVPEGRHVFPQLTVAQNLRLGSWPHRKDRKGTRDYVERAVEYFPRLRERWTQLAGTMSGGEQQMLAIARGMMARPKLLLIDEASLGLSPKLTETVFEVAQRINADGTTVLMVEQNAGALTFASKVFVMEKGTLTFQGTEEELIENSSIREAILGAGV